MNAAQLMSMKSSRHLLSSPTCTLLLRLFLAAGSIVLGFACLPLAFVFLPLPATWIKWLSVIFLGLFGGAIVRWLLDGRSLALKWLAALSSLAAGLWLSGWLTQGYLGFPWKPLPFSEVQTESLLAWGLAGVMAGFSLHIHRGTGGAVKVKTKSKTLNGARLVSPPKKNAAKRKSGVRPAKPQPAVRLQTRRSHLKASVRKPGLGLRAWLRHVRELGKRRFQFPWRNLVRSRRSILRKDAALHLNGRKHTRPRASVVQLSAQVEHRCPYCLEEIRSDDPRGVKVCPVCHTRHHLDCWMVTGTCQVPHQH